MIERESSSSTATGLTSTERHAALDAALAAAHEVAEVLREGFRRDDLEIEHKSDVDPVTEYDRRAEAIIVDRLRRAFPDHRLRGEEGGSYGADAADEARPLWYIDPLDGTVNYTHHIPWYAVSLGLEMAGLQEVALVLAVEQGWAMTALRGEGTLRDGAPVRVSQAKDLVSGLFATGFPYDRGSFDNVEELRAVLHGTQGIRRMGTASLDLAAVACAWIEGFWELGLKPWDMSAGALLVAEAGGRVTALDGEPFRSEVPSIVATNGALHDDLLAILRRVGTSPDPALSDEER
ncbi:MAG: inositol monophosphatase [Deltaproteobacteria bacterium]|nr:inositol monophosphatase [Deltaproteobacteria bacterium]